MKNIFLVLVVLAILCFTTSCNTQVNESNLEIQQEGNKKNATEVDIESNLIDKQEKLSDHENTNNEILDNTEFDGIPIDTEEQFLFFLSELSRLKYKCNSNTVETTINSNNVCDILWIFNPQKFNDMYLWFYPNGEFYIGTNYHGVWFATGKYEVIDSETMRLFEFSKNLDIIGYDDLNEIKLKIKCNPRHFYYEELLYIDGTNDYFGNANTCTVSEGEFDLNNISVIKEYGKFVVVENLRFRSEPNITSDTIPVYYFGYGTKDYFVKGSLLNSIAKSVLRYEIDGFNNYWYYIDYYDDEYHVTGWVYGEFIEPYNEDLRDYYYDIYKEEIEIVFSD